MKPQTLLFIAALVALTSHARAQDGPPETLGDAFGRFFEGAVLRKETPPAADFVTRSRPAQLDYAPLAAPAPRPNGKKNKETYSALEKELDSAAASNRARAARVKIPDPPANETKARRNEK